MRYVSIQLGIGGFKPFSVLFVDEKKYGDCKALTNYMRYALEEVGIKSYPALIKSGHDADYMDTSFPKSVFNHVILCIPNSGDTIWLECTSKSSDPGTLGTFTENRYALLVTENGGKLVRTPSSLPDHNIFSTRAVVTLGQESEGEAQFKIKTTGSYKDELLNYFLEEKKDDQKDYLVSRIALKMPDDFEVRKIDRSDTLAIHMNLLLRKSS